MENWFDIVEPHEDIKSGDFDESVFAAKLDEVVSGVAPADYSDPYIFISKTYFTVGITELLKKVQRKLTEGKGSGVIEIQTPFGGGKTHALVCIYHHIKNGDKVKSILPESLELVNAKTAVIVGNALSPLEGRNVENINIKTLWGEIAYQLAGNSGYQEFEADDKSGIAPGKDKLRKFLEKQQPFIMLFDEILGYIVRAVAVHYKDTNLATQTLEFLHELTETVSSLEKGMMIVTLPSSELEDPSEKPREMLNKLERVFFRVESIETPVKGEEIYSIIASRLFQKTLDDAKKNKIIHDYFSLYQDIKDEIPQHAREVDFKRKMELAYPFHPDTIDILYEKWGTYSSFQRTRGVLRLLANVVEDLYKREKNIDIILPSDINLANPPIRNEFLRHIGGEYEGVIGSDIAGHEAKAQILDNANKSWKHLAERISTAIFFYSFSADASQRGINLPFVKLATLRSDTIPPMVTEVLQKLSNTLWYLKEKNGSYFFSRIPNLNRMVQDKKELYQESYEDELKEIIRKEVGKTFKSYIWPERSEEIADDQELKLMILHPKFNEGDVDSWFDRKGEGFRIYKNTLIFAFSDISALSNFREEIKTALALRDIKKDIESGENEQLRGKLSEVKDRLNRIERDYSYNLRRTYHILQVGNEIIDLGQPGVGKETLSGWYKRELENREKLVNNLHYRFIANRFLTNGKVSTKTILEQFYKDKNLMMLTSKEVIRNTIRQGVADGAFGIVYTQDGEIQEEELKFKTNITAGEVSFDDNEYILSKDYCLNILKKIEEKRKEEEEKERKEDYGEDKEETEEGRLRVKREGYEREKDEPEEPMAEKYRTVSLKIEGIPSSKIADLNRGVLMPISKEIGTFNFKIEIDISDDEGISKSTIDEAIRDSVKGIGGRIVDEKKE